MSEYRVALESLWADPWEPKEGPLAKWLTAHHSQVEQCLRSVPQKQLAELLGISYQTLGRWAKENNVPSVDGRTTRPIPGLVRPPAASEVKPPAETPTLPAEAEGAGTSPGINSGIKASPAGQDPRATVVPSPAPDIPPPQTVKELQAYIAGMKATLRLIFSKEESYVEI